MNTSPDMLRTHYAKIDGSSLEAGELHRTIGEAVLGTDIEESIVDKNEVLIQGSTRNAAEGRLDLGVDSNLIGEVACGPMNLRGEQLAAKFQVQFITSWATSTVLRDKKSRVALDDVSTYMLFYYKPVLIIFFVAQY